MEILEENASPVIDEKEAENLLRTHFDLHVDKMKKLDGYFDLNFHFTCKNGRDFDNCSHGYILKIINKNYSNDVEFFKEYFNILVHLKNTNFPCQIPVKNIKGEYFSYCISQEKNKNDSKHIFYVLTFLPGEVLHDVHYNKDINYSIGFILRDMHQKLQKFNDSPPLNRPNACGAPEAPSDSIEQMLNSTISDEEQRTLVQQCCLDFRKIVLENIHKFEKGIIHADLNLANILVQKTGPESNTYEIVGIIDFVELQYSGYIFDLALTACYISLHDVHHYDDDIALFLAGYGKELTKFELQVLKICICMRICQAVVLGTHILSVQPDNNYIREADSQKYGWILLEKLSKMSHSAFAELIQNKLTTLPPQEDVKINYGNC